MKRVAVFGPQPEVLTNIFDESVNLACWQRSMEDGVQSYTAFLLKQGNFTNLRFSVAPHKMKLVLYEELPMAAERDAFISDVMTIVDMYTCLFESPAIGFRLSRLERAMCPRFHTDKVPCRLITTYGGSGTEWVPDPHVERSLLGKSIQGVDDIQSGLIRRRESVQTLVEGDVALLKGESWEGNEGFGAVHRSPSPAHGSSRLLLTLDMVMS